MGTEDRHVYAYGSLWHHVIVSSLEHAIERAHETARDLGETRYILRIDLTRPDLMPEILGQATALD